VPVEYITSGGPSRSSDLGSVTADVNVSNTLNPILEGMIFIDASWMPSESQREDLEDILMSGIPVITMGGSELFIDKDVNIGAVAYSETSTASGFFYDAENDIRYCYSVECDPVAASVMMYNWAGDMAENGITMPYSNGLPPAGSIISSKDLSCGNQGWLRISTYYLLTLTESGMQYWVAHYSVETVPDAGNYTTRTIVKNDVDRYADSELIRHGPSTSAKISASLGTEGPDVTSVPRWSHSVPDVSVLNRSNLALNHMEIEHSFVSSSNASKSAFSMESDMTFRCENASGYAHMTDTYSVEFCKKTAFGIEYSHTAYSTAVTQILYQDR